MKDKVKLRVALPEEEEILYSLYVSTRKSEFAILEWDEQQIEGLLRMQYDAQKVSYQQQFPNAKYEIIMYEDVGIGRLIAEVQQKAIRLIDIFILPEYRGRGICTTLLKELQQIAAELRLPLELNVLMGNPAQRLYERLGFVVTDETPPYLLMIWEVDR
ncbi:GNAT family N-acetyltransferase [Lysinibacillus macroides]|uniref:Acetyltransferase n=1 Tax=Lysinibacillus macroides TaxID=33935 RepID=A0A0M9DN71_9BACI|nr:GNAT family N-acetyltransferase [Lysinibacillus macroides]KOY83800.1 acetyltransferase [Lysinibacillus macroides]QPR67067.1 GNAT family N-acetyltransferase [Lysinibacillus macroides]